MKFRLVSYNDPCSNHKNIDTLEVLGFPPFFVDCLVYEFHPFFDCKGLSSSQKEVARRKNIEVVFKKKYMFWKSSRPNNSWLVFRMIHVKGFADTNEQNLVDLDFMST